MRNYVALINEREREKNSIANIFYIRAKLKLNESWRFRQFVMIVYVMENATNAKLRVQSQR